MNSTDRLSKLDSPTRIPLNSTPSPRDIEGKTERPTTTEEETEDTVVTEMATTTREVAKMELTQSREETPMTTPITRVETREEEETMTIMIMMIMVIMMMKVTITTKKEVVTAPEEAISQEVVIEEVTKRTSTPEVEINLVTSLEIETRTTGRRTLKRDLNQSQPKLKRKREFFTSTTCHTLLMRTASPKLSRNLEPLRRFQLVTEETVDHRVMPPYSSRPRMVLPKPSKTSTVRKLMEEPSR